MEDKRNEADDPFYDRIPHERRRQSIGESTDKSGAQRHAAYEYDQYDGLRVRSMADEQLEVVRPDRFVDQAAHA